MNKTTPGSDNQASASQPQRRPALTVAAALAFAFASSVVAQQVDSSPALVAANDPNTALPDSPTATLDAPAPGATISSSSRGRVDLPPRDSDQAALMSSAANSRQKYISPGQVAPPLTVGNKVFLGIKDSVTPIAAFGWLISAGYEQVTDGSPNYGSNPRAFAQRLGAAAARGSSESIFSDSIAASILREDPRYYRMGSGNNPLKRVSYAISRVFITRTDSGRPTVNVSLLAGNLAGAYLTKAYYPALNTSNTEVLKTFGGSLAGSAFSFGIHEFFSGTISLMHPKSSL